MKEDEASLSEEFEQLIPRLEQRKKISRELQRLCQ
jgi:hypothetical protein